MDQETQPSSVTVAPAPGDQPRLARRHTVRRRSTKRRRRFAISLVLVVLFAPFVWSYVTTMLKPSSLPLSIRSVEWVRANGFAWLVDDAERKWYSWHAPKKGGPGLTTLPAVGRPLPSRVIHRPRAEQPPNVRIAIHPRLSGEGRWGPSGYGGASVLVTTFRTDPSYPRLLAYVAWVNHTRTQLALYPGRYEPPNAPARGPMQVPYGERWRLLATFNSGFTYKDGHGGFAINGTSYEPLRSGDATLLVRRNGTVDVRAWNGGAVPPARIVLARQNLHLIVAAGKPGPNLGDGSAWGATLGNAIRVWRSGVGVDSHGNLIYAAADYQTVSSLADIFIRAGAVRAMELDINAEWPSFNTYGHSGARDPLKLVPNGQQRSSRYLAPDDRDFFAVFRRIPRTTLSVPLR